MSKNKGKQSQPELPQPAAPWPAGQVSQAKPSEEQGEPATELAQTLQDVMADAKELVARLQLVLDHMYPAKEPAQEQPAEPAKPTDLKPQPQQQRKLTS